MPKGQQVYVRMHGVKPEDLSRNIQYRNSGVLPPRPRKAMARVSELVERAAREQEYIPGRKVAIFLSFPFGSKRSDVDGPIKRTIDAIEKGLRAAGPDESWNDRSVHAVQATRVAKDHTFDITVYNLPDEG